LQLCVTPAVLSQAETSYVVPGVTRTAFVFVIHRAMAFSGCVEAIFSECVGECAWSVAQVNAPVPLVVYELRGSASNEGKGARF
jgi:hypothetical protein